MCHYCVPHIHHRNRRHLALLCWGRSLSRGTSWYSWRCTTLQSEKRTSYRLYMQLISLTIYLNVHVPTCSRVVVWQANQSVARTRLAVGKAVGGDVVYHLISFCRLHLYYHLQDTITKQQQKFKYISWMPGGILVKPFVNKPFAAAGRSECLCSQTGTPCVGRRCV